MRRLILAACVLGLLMPAAAWAAPFDVMPGQTLAVDNIVGTALGPIYDPATGNGDILGGCATIAVGSKVFNAGNTKLMRMSGVITGATGGTEASWAGVWIAWGLNEMSWIDGSDGIYSDPEYGQGWSYRDGWIGSSNMVAYTGAVPGDYPTTGFSLIMEDSRRADAPVAGLNTWGDIVPTPYDDVPSVKYSKVGFQMNWDMTNYAPGSKDTLGSYRTTTWDPSVTPSTPIKTDFPETPVTVGIRHSLYPETNPMFFDDYTDTVMYVSIVNDNIGTGSVTWTDIALEVVGKLPGDANLDGVVDDKDASIVGANWMSTGAGWQQGDFGGGGSGAWGGLDGIVNDIDAAILAAHMGDRLNPLEAPEPSTFCLLVLGALVLFGRKLVKR